jgi:glycosyltransferase involved in cell wall biosynthesis
LRRAVGADDSRRPIALLFHPVFWPYARHLRPLGLIYYSYDAHHLAPGWTEELARYEASLVEAADLIAAFSRGMLDHMPGDGPRRGRVLPTGVDVEPFESSDLQPCPEDLARIPRPRIGYVGRVNQKLDHALILGVATRRPDWHWVFVGRVGAYPDGRFAADAEAESLWRRCIALPNVHTLENKPHDDVPRYLRNMDLNALCYRTSGSGWWSEIFPVKSLEYLAAGRPIVSTPVKSLHTFSDHMAFGSTADEWVAAIESGLRDGGPGTEVSRRALARSNTWDDRINCLEGWMLELTRSGRVSPRAEQSGGIGA